MNARSARRFAGAALIPLAAIVAPPLGRTASAEPARAAASGPLTGWTSLTLGADKAVVFTASAILSVSPIRGRARAIARMMKGVRTERRRAGTMQTAAKTANMASQTITM